MLECSQEIKIIMVSRQTISRWIREAIQPFVDWHACQQVFDAATHTCVGKESGQTAHVERFNGTLRRRLARFVRRTLSFSKSDAWHYIVIKWFIITYNLDILHRTLGRYVISLSLTC